MSNRPSCPSHQIFELPAFIRFQYLGFPLASPQRLAFILLQYLNFLPGAPQQLPAFILLQYLNLLPGASSNFLHSFGFISGSPVAPPQFLACILLQYLCLSAASSTHAVSISKAPPSFCHLLALILLPMSNFPPPTCLSLTNFLRSPSFNIYMFVSPFLSTSSCMHLVSIPKFPPPCAFQQLPAFIWSQTFPLRRVTFFGMYLHWCQCPKERRQGPNKP